MNQVLTTALTKLDLVKGSFLGSMVYMNIAFQNKGQKPIAGVKGTAVFRDMFGDTLATESVSYDKGIPVNGVKQFRQIAAAGMDRGERKLAETPIEKVKFTFDPVIILFEDGTKLEMPKGDDQ
jgi:hypothetical protein